MTTFSKQNISDFYPENIHQRIYRMARKPNISLFFPNDNKKVTTEIQKIPLQYT